MNFEDLYQEAEKALNKLAGCDKRFARHLLSKHNTFTHEGIQFKVEINPESTVGDFPGFTVTGIVGGEKVQADIFLPFEDSKSYYWEM